MLQIDRDLPAEARFWVTALSHRAQHDSQRTPDLDRWQALAIDDYVDGVVQAGQTVVEQDHKRARRYWLTTSALARTLDRHDEITAIESCIDKPGQNIRLGTESHPIMLPGHA